MMTAFGNRWIARMIILLGVAWGGLVQAASRESFDTAWRFERFGPSPTTQGVWIDEPGAIDHAATASSEQAGNTAENAFDGNTNTRWCASSDALPEWVGTDLGAVTNLGAVEILFEMPGNYGYEFQYSTDGTNWSALPARIDDGAYFSFAAVSARYVRLNITSTPANYWACVWEFKVFDGAGAFIDLSTPQEAAPPLSLAGYDDSAWRQLDVPHDWGIEGPFRDDLAGDTAKLPWEAIGWYRKTYSSPASDAGKRVYLDFDGAMAYAEVFLNGTKIGEWPFGYNSFRVDLTDHLLVGQDNQVAVRLDTTKWGSRWYPGGGIYRHVWMVKSEPVHVAHWGTYVTTPTLTDTQGVAQIQVVIDNTSGAAETVTARTHLFELGRDDQPGAWVAGQTNAPQVVAADALATNLFSIAVADPRRWDVEAPERYMARTELLVGGSVVDTYDTPFGFRTLEFTHDDGFHLNGRRVQVQGVCLHHDLGPLGAAMNTRALERQLEIMQGMGCNAIRTSHNPPTPELLDLCDKMGLLVQVEAFDCWSIGKVPGDYSVIFDEWHERDLRALIRRDRNHPSVFMWSTGNELFELPNASYTWISQMLTDIIHSEDLTRPVQLGCNSPNGGTVNGYQHTVDVMGYNYYTGSYGPFKAYNPTIPLIASETSSCVSSRGEYFFPMLSGNTPQRADFQVSSYDLHHPGWGCTPDTEFAALAANPWMIGEFVWTGFDYLGEPTPYNYNAPSRSSYFGIVDFCGFKKDRYHSYFSQWRPDVPSAHIFPHWTWPERVGLTTPVHVYTSGDEAELFLNDVSQGRKSKGSNYRIRWDNVVYQPGELRVVAYKNGALWAEDTVQTTGAPAQLELTADRTEIRPDGADLSFITIAINDAAGRNVPRASNTVSFAVSGPGELIAVGNGDATSHASFQASQRDAYNGLCLAIVRSFKDQPGTITLTATSPGLTNAAVLVVSQLPAQLPPVWNESPISETATRDRAFSGTLYGAATDPNDNAITYSKAGGPGWLNIAANGVLSGTPVSSGTNAFTVLAHDGNTAPSTNTLQIIVLEPLPPVWSQNPVQMHPAVADIPYTGTLAGLASDQSGDAIAYSLAEAPSWLDVASDGTLSGTPLTGNIGSNSFLVAATDIDGSSTSALHIVVLEAFDPSSSSLISINFAQDPNQAFAGGEPIGPLASDSAYWNTTINRDAGSLAEGSLDGLVDDTGTNTGASVSWSAANTWYNNGGISDDENKLATGYLDDTTGISVTVSNVPYAHYRVLGLFSSDKSNGGASITGQDFQVNGAWVYGGTTSLTTAANGSIAVNQTVNSELWTETIPGVATGNYWAIKGSSPTLSITGLAKVDDLVRGSLTGLVIQKLAPPQPPAWVENPVVGTGGQANSAYTGSLAGKATDANGDPITYSLQSGPAWLNVAPDGTLGGTPGVADDGWNSFTVAATDVDGTTPATLNIFILPIPGAPDIVLIDNATANGSFEDPASGKVMFSTGTIPFWENWSEQDSADNDTGTDAAAGGNAGLDGARVAFIQPGGAIVNMVTNNPHTIAAGDTIVYSCWNTLTGRSPVTLSLVYDEGGTLNPIPGSGIIVAEGTQAIGQITVQPGDLWVGKILGIGISESTHWPEVDQVVLGVTSPVIEPVPASVTFSVSADSVELGSTNLPVGVGVTNHLQFKADLLWPAWSNLYSVSGIAETNWSFSTSTQGFYRIETTY